MNSNLSIDRLSNLRTLGYQGCDVDLAASVYEYGFAWRRVDNDLHIIYMVVKSDTPWECRYGNGYINASLDPREEWDWVDWDDFEEFVRYRSSDYPLWMVVEDLIRYKGYEEIMGSCYYPLKIRPDEDPRYCPECGCHKVRCVVDITETWDAILDLEDETTGSYTNKRDYQEIQVSPDHPYYCADCGAERELPDD